MSDFTTGKLKGDYQAMYINVGSLVSRLKEALLPALTGQPSSSGVSASRAAQQPGHAGIAEEPSGCVLVECIADGRAATNTVRIRRPPGPGQWPDMRGIGDEDRFPHGLPVLPALGPFGPATGGGAPMLVGPHHPGFHEPPNHLGPRPPGVPPQARYDPFGACQCELVRLHHRVSETLEGQVHRECQASSLGASAGSAVAASAPTSTRTSCSLALVMTTTQCECVCGQHRHVCGSSSNTPASMSASSSALSLWSGRPTTLW